MIIVLLAENQLIAEVAALYTGEEDRSDLISSPVELH